VGLWSLLTGWQKKNGSRRASRRTVRSELKLLQAGRYCRFEAMEERRLLDADPIKVGVTYFEGDGGSDIQGDTFEILFQGGADGTELTRAVIDGDHNPAGLSFGDMIFDTVKGGLGADEAYALQIVSSTGIDEVTWQVADGGTSLVFQFRGFNTGEKLVFSIDVDEVQEFDPAETNVNKINEGLDPIASGVEFQGSHFTADFKAPHYYDISGTGEFRNQYDPLFAGTSLLVTQGNANGLPNDNFDGKRDRSTGTLVPLQQIPLPASVRGRVHLTDREGDCFSEEALASPLEGVKITLKDASGNVVGTMFTNANGEYAFENLLPGIYTIIEETPPGLIDGADHIGTIDGIKVGTKPANDILTNITLQGGDNGINYDFCEHLPASVSGHVYHDANNNGIREASEDPIPGTTVILLDAGGTQISSMTTDSTGFYKFANLSAGAYLIREIQPGGWTDGKDAAGTINGQVVGSAQNPGDQISGVALLWGDDGINYDFGEYKAGSIRGQVKEDPDCASCECEEGEGTFTPKPIAGVTVQLLDQNGVIIRTTTTDQNGEYEFTDLAPGIYAVRELQPNGYLQAGQSIGGGGGDATVTDVLSNIPVRSGDHLIDYDFCELLPVTIAGVVWVDSIRNCEIEENEARLPGVTIQLFDASGTIIATTVTGADGSYKFENLLPGTYSVHEVQPQEYFDGCTHAGSLGGNDSVENDITQIVTKSGDNGINYNFGEILAGKISGFVFRDGAPIVTQDGTVPANLYDLRDGQLTPDDLRLRGVLLELRYTLTGEPVMGEDLLGSHPSGPMRTRTDANGYYEFNGLPAGNYSVFEAQPGGFEDSRDTPGTTNGLAVNVGTLVSPFVALTFATAGVSFKNDAILQVPLAFGQHSQLNNFSEVQVVTTIIPPPPETPEPPPPLPPPFLLVFPQPVPPPEFFAVPAAAPIVTGGGGEYTWHLSVIDAGHPRVARRSTRQGDLAFRPALWIERTEWQPDRLRDGVWLVHGAVDPAPHALFGLPEAIPVTGDFNGDGKTEVGIFYKGEWFLDLNGNGQWDAADLWAKLGDEQDRPITGDWDGDGKDDIGIYGPEWPGDPVHLEHEAGLPDQDNQRVHKLRAKNVPPNPEEATDGERLMRLTAQGKERADLIDHVFQFGSNNDIPISGDWNGDGIRSIGVFRDGRWHFDMDGDGRWSDGDKVADFGAKGDLPVVGDFNGDGTEEIAIFRDGKWIIDTNGNREIDAADRTLQFGQAGDKPVTGDFDGDGADEPAVFRPQ
jgi:serine-aspartate repeat-containing protein C/D/E